MRLSSWRIPMPHTRALSHRARGGNRVRDGLFHGGGVAHRATADGARRITGVELVERGTVIVGDRLQQLEAELQSVNATAST